VNDLRAGWIGRMLGVEVEAIGRVSEAQRIEPETKRWSADLVDMS
jgi:hypothetical protein